MKQTNQKFWRWGAALAVVVVAAAAWSFWNARQQKLQDSHSDRLFQARTNWTAERQASKLSEFKRADARVLYPKTVAALSEIDRDGKSTQAAQEARLWLAQIYLRHGQPELAQPLYENAVRGAKGALEKGLSLQGLASAWEAQGKLEEALKALDQAITAVDASVQGEILLNVARLAVALGQRERASKALTQIIEKHPSTEWAQEAQRMKATLEQGEGAARG